MGVSIYQERCLVDVKTSKVRIRVADSICRSDHATRRQGHEQGLELV